MHSLEDGATHSRQAGSERRRSAGLGGLSPSGPDVGSDRRSTRVRDGSDDSRQSLGLASERPLGAHLVQNLDAELSWEQQARCRQRDPALFFGPNRFEPKRERLARESEAKAVCSTCPCIQACREHALATGELYGVWGGLGESDRRELLASRGSIATAV